jgi:hypothetical protein
MTKAKINQAIQQYNVEIISRRGAGYSYFIDLNTQEQIGESVMVCYLKQQTLEQWVEHACWAREEHSQTLLCTSF